MSKAHAGVITGDVAASTDVTINKKGGSVTATLKKSLRDSLGDLGESVAAATVEFSTGQAILLLSGVPGAAEKTAAEVHVRKVGPNRFEIELDTDEDEEVDEVTAAFLRLKIDQFTKGGLKLAEPVTADRWRTRVSTKIAAAKSAAERTLSKKSK